MNAEVSKASCKKKILLKFTFVAVIIALVALTAATYVRVYAQPLKGKNIKIAYIVKGGGQETTAYLNELKRKGEAAGAVAVDIFVANNDRVKFHDMIMQVGGKGYYDVQIWGSYGQETEAYYAKIAPTVLKTSGLSDLDVDVELEAKKLNNSNLWNVVRNVKAGKGTLTSILADISSPFSNVILNALY